MSRSICTIIAKNYISFARTLCASFLKHNKDGRCYVLIIDEFDDYINPSLEEFEVIHINALGVKNINDICFKYNITELATAFKPYFLEYILTKKNVNQIIYLDPDILVTYSLEPLYKELNKSNIILTPHLDKDYPDDGLMPNDSHIMKSGIFNLGFIGLCKCENVFDFLKWWQDKLYNKCVIDPCSGYFVDQKFIDLAITLFKKVTILDDTGYNVAYWNIHSRFIHQKNSIWMCNEGVLYFYHFSNYKPDKPDILSGYQSRFFLKNIPQLHDIFRLYTELLNKNGYKTSKQWPYSYSHYLNGKIIKDIDRKVYRNYLSKHSLGNPFDLMCWPTQLRVEIVKQKIINMIIKGLNSSISELIRYGTTYLSKIFQ